MALLKRKAEKTTTISVRVPVSTKGQIDALRPLADEAGYDLTASLSDAVVRWTKQVSEELQGTTPTVHKPLHSNGADPERV
jgi:hypothetical protein